MVKSILIPTKHGRQSCLKETPLTSACSMVVCFSLAASCSFRTVTWWRVSSCWRFSVSACSCKLAYSLSLRPKSSFTPWSWANRKLSFMHITRKIRDAGSLFLMKYPRREKCSNLVLNTPRLRAQDGRYWWNLKQKETSNLSRHHYGRSWIKSYLQVYIHKKNEGINSWINTTPEGKYAETREQKKNKCKVKRNLRTNNWQTSSPSSCHRQTQDSEKNS